MKTQKRQNESGSVLILALLVSVLLLGMGLTVTWLANQQTKVSGSMTRRGEAMAAARTGLERARSILATTGAWADELNGCAGSSTDTDKGVVLCAGGAPLEDLRVVESGTQLDSENVNTSMMRYTVWIRNDDEEGAGNADTDNRITIRSEGVGRDGLSLVVLETTFSRAAGGGVQEANYSQSGMSSSGSNSARAALSN